jgi:hypothetical protein
MTDFRGAIVAILSLSAAVPAMAADIAYTETALSIPMTDAQDVKRTLAGKLCVPGDARGKSRLVIINHGSPARASDRPGMELGSCDSEPAQWFLARHFAVVYALRRGYGTTGGEWAEGYGSCNRADYARAGLESARDIAAIVDYATALPQVMPYGAVVAGVSAGGWGTLAYDSVSHPKVIALIDMAGGRGGHQTDGDRNCSTDKLATAAAVYGRTASTPMIWIYAANDSFFGPDVAQSLYGAFTASGGKAEFQAVGPFGRDGHYLWSARGGSNVWGPLVERYLMERGALGPSDK